MNTEAYDSPLLNRYFELAANLGIYPRVDNLRYFARNIYAGVDLRGRRVLEVGSGTGVYGLYAACSGASETVLLEPEVDGSVHGVRAKCERYISGLGLDNVRIEAKTLQDYDPGGRRFDVIVSIASINHWNEQACIRLHQDEAARRVYREIFSKLYDLTADGGDLIVLDCGRRNFFGELHLPDPFTHSIEWEKHQPPAFWAEWLAEVGYCDPRIRWNAFNTLRDPGRMLLGNRLGAYFFGFFFELKMRKSMPR